MREPVMRKAPRPLLQTEADENPKPAQNAARRNAVSSRCPMLKKYGRFHAGWRDEHGKRKRKSFTTPQAAQRFLRKVRTAVTAPLPRKGCIGAPQHKEKGQIFPLTLSVGLESAAGAANSWPVSTRCPDEE